MLTVNFTSSKHHLLPMPYANADADTSMLTVSRNRGGGRSSSSHHQQQDSSKFGNRPIAVPPPPYVPAVDPSNNMIAESTSSEETPSSSSSSSADIQQKLIERGKLYPQARHNFEVDPQSPRSHWRRINAVNDNVLPYLLAHGLPQSKAMQEMNREYVQRWRLIRTVRDSAGGGAVYEIDTDWGRRVQIYDIDDGGWDEECPDDAVLFGRHTQQRLRPAVAARGNPAASSAATDQQKQAQKEEEKKQQQPTKNRIHRRSQWEGRSFVASTISPTGGLVERTERYLASATELLSSVQRDHLPQGADDTIMVVERTYSPEDVPEIISCREIFVRCYHHRDDEAKGGGGGAACDALPVLSCPFEDISCIAGNGGEKKGGETTTATTTSTKNQIRVRTVLIPICCGDDNNATAAAAAAATAADGRYRVCIEGDAPDLISRGVLGLLSDAAAVAGVTSSARDVLGIDPAGISAKLGIESAEPSQRRVLEDAARIIRRQVSDLLAEE